MIGIIWSFMSGAIVSTFNTMLKLISSSLGFIQLHWKELLFILMFLLIAYQNFATTRYLLWMETIPSLELRLAKQKVLTAKTQNERDACFLNNKLLADTIDQRNDEIKKWKRVSDRLEVERTRLLNDVITKRILSEYAATSILKKPPPGSCEEAFRYLLNSFEETKWPN